MHEIRYKNFLLLYFMKSGQLITRRLIHCKGLSYVQFRYIRL